MQHPGLKLFENSSKVLKLFELANILKGGITENCKIKTKPNNGLKEILNWETEWAVWSKINELYPVSQKCQKIQKIFYRFLVEKKKTIETNKLNGFPSFII